MQKKLTILRVITDGRVLPWHLEKTIIDFQDKYNIIVVGENVSKFKSDFLKIECIDIPITPKIRIFKDFFGLILLGYIIFKKKPDIIHSIMPKAGLLSSLSAYFFVKVRIHTFTGQVWQTKKGLGKYLLKMLDKLVINLNTYCLTDSPSQSQYLFSEGIKSKTGNVIDVLSRGSLGGVDLEKINIKNKKKWADEIKEKYSIQDNKIVIGFLARKTLDKGALVMLEAFSILLSKNKNVVLFFIGPDSTFGALDHVLPFLKESKQMIELGQVENYERFLAAFDFLCVPSFREGFGSIVVDAAALAIPTIGSNIPGLTDAIVDGVTGELFEAGNSKALASYLEFYATSPDIVKLRGQQAYERTINFFDSKKISKCLEDKYLELVDL